MATLAEFTPLRQESIDSIRDRIDGATNAGRDPGDPRWTDTTPGGFFWDHTQAFALEAEYLWDFASTELPASFFLPFSWGIYLDYWGDLLGVARKDASVASGEVTLVNTGAVPVLIGTGTQVAAPANDVESDPLIFATTAAVTLAAGATATLAAVAVQPGSEYNVAAGAVTLMLSPIGGVTVTNAAAMGSGSDVEADEPYKQRLLLEFSASRGGGTRDDYIADALSQPGVGHVFVQPRWAGNGTVRLILTTPTNDPLSTPALATIQEFFDPTGSPGDGNGAAPINHVVTVATVAVINVPISATLVLESGFSIAGDVNSQAVQQAIWDAISAYFATLGPGDDVQHNRVLAAIIDVPGVHDVTALTINGSTTADRAIAPLEVARTATPIATLT